MPATEASSSRPGASRPAPPCELRQRALRAGEKSGDVFERALCGAAIPFHQSARRGAHLLAPCPVLDQLDPGDAKVLGAVHLDAGSGFQKHRSHFAKILHRRAKQRRLAECSGLQDVMPARRHQRSAHKDRVRKPVESGKLADAIEENNAYILIEGAADCAIERNPAAPQKFAVRLFNQTRCDVEAFGLTRRKHKQSRRHWPWEIPKAIRTSDSSPSVTLPATITGPRSWRRNSPSSHVTIGEELAGARSYFRLPATTTRSADAPNSRSRRASSSLCIRNRLLSASTRARNPRSTPLKNRNARW